jgi:hypothetical protein
MSFDSSRESLLQLFLLLKGSTDWTVSHAVDAEIIILLTINYEVSKLAYLLSEVLESYHFLKTKEISRGGLC